MRFLAIDLGDKRTGLATGDDVMGLVSPIEVLAVSIGADGGNALRNAVLRAIEEQLGARDGVVVGLPLNMDGTEGPRAKLAREFGEEIARGSGREVFYQDERLTSVEADWSLVGSELTRKQRKGVRDALAAAAILRDFLAERMRRHDAGGRGAEGPERASE